MKQAVLDEMRRHFRPEFLNRVDETIVSHALSEEHLKEIVDLPVSATTDSTGRAPYPDRVDRCRPHPPGAHGLQPSYGARPLKRAIQKEWKRQWRGSS